MSDRSADWEQRLRAIDWSSYETAYGSAGPVPAQLLGLLSRESDVWQQASHELWASLCHQHAYVSSAALPALPFLVEVLDDASDALAVEIFDILVGFAVCTRADRTDRPDWAEQLRAGLYLARPIAERFATGGDEESSDFARWFLAELEAGR